MALSPFVEPIGLPSETMTHVSSGRVYFAGGVTPTKRVSPTYGTLLVPRLPCLLPKQGSDSDRTREETFHGRRRGERTRFTPSALIELETLRRGLSD